MRKFEWDEAKNERNKTKHGIDFETAQLAFDDPSVSRSSKELTMARSGGTQSA